MIVLLVIGLLTAPLAQTPASVTPASPLQVKAEVVRAVTCKADSEMLGMVLLLRLLVTNDTTHGLIVPAAQTMFGFRIAPTPDVLQGTQWSSLTTILANEPVGRKRPPIRDTPDARFIILKPGETRDLPLHATILLFAKDALDTMSAETSSGALYDMTQGEWLEAERKWKSVGELFSASVRSGPFRVTVTPAGERKQCE